MRTFLEESSPFDKLFLFYPRIPLHVVAEEGYVDGMKSLLDEEVYITIKDNKGVI